MSTDLDSLHEALHDTDMRNSERGTAAVVMRSDVQTFGQTTNFQLLRLGVHARHAESVSCTASSVVVCEPYYRSTCGVVRLSQLVLAILGQLPS